MVKLGRFKNYYGISLKMIDNIIFDLGGILVPENREEILASVAESIEIGRQNLEDRVKTSRSRIIKGEIGLVEFYSEVLKAIGRDDITAEQVFLKHLEIYKATSTQRDPQILDLIERLKAEGYYVHCATNTEREIAEFNKRNGLFNHFRMRFISTDMGVSKEEVAFYEHALRELRIKPERGVLIDNEQRCIEAAKQAGLHTVLYGRYEEGYSQLPTDLGRLSIKI